MIEKAGSKLSREVYFQVILHLLVFISFSFDRNPPRIEFHQVVFFLNYAVAAFIFNYLLFPRFLYRKRHLLFIIYAVVVFAGVIIM